MNRVLTILILILVIGIGYSWMTTNNDQEAMRVSESNISDTMESDMKARINQAEEAAGTLSNEEHASDSDEHEDDSEHGDDHGHDTADDEHHDASH